MRDDATGGGELKIWQDSKGLDIYFYIDRSEVAGVAYALGLKKTICHTEKGGYPQGVRLLDALWRVGLHYREAS